MLLAKKPARRPVKAKPAAHAVKTTENFVSKLFRLLSSAFSDPEKMLHHEAGHPSLGEGAKLVIASAFFSNLIAGLVSLLLVWGAKSTFITAATTLGVIFAPLLSTVMAVFIWLVFAFFVNLVSKSFMGGLGRFERQAYLDASVFPAIGLLGILSEIFALFPQVGPWVAVIPALVGFYLSILATKVAQGIGFWRALATWVITVVALGIAIAAILLVVALVAGVGLIAQLARA